MSTTTSSSVDPVNSFISSDPNLYSNLYARYIASNFNANNNSWNDDRSIGKRTSFNDIPRSGITNSELKLFNNKKLTSYGSNGASNDFAVLQGTQNDKIIITNNPITPYTLIYVARYSDDTVSRSTAVSTTYNRIIASADSTINWYSGFGPKIVGCANHSTNNVNQFVTDNKGVVPVTNWIISSDRSQDYRCNGVSRTLASIDASKVSSNLPTIGVNVVGTQWSNFNIAEIIIFNSVLSSDQITGIEKALSIKYGIPIGSNSVLTNVITPTPTIR